MASWSRRPPERAPLLRLVKVGVGKSAPLLILHAGPCLGFKFVELMALKGERDGRGQ